MKDYPMTSLPRKFLEDAFVRMNGMENALVEMTFILFIARINPPCPDVLYCRTTTHIKQFPAKLGVWPGSNNPIGYLVVST